MVHDTAFYCVANMPGVVAADINFRADEATMPYVDKPADNGRRAACQPDAALANGLSTHEGTLLSDEEDTNLVGVPFTDPVTLLT